MPLFVYDWPNWLFGLACVAFSIIVAISGVFASRPLQRVLDADGRHNDIVNYFLSACGVFYGLTLGLIAVGSWTRFSDVESKVSAEAASLAALYRDVSSYPEPSRTTLRADLKEYTRYLIEEAWPLQRTGVVPSGGTQRITTFQEHLYAIEPSTKGQEALHSETLGQFNALVESRRQRLSAVTTGLPAVLWAIVFAGGFLSISLTWLFHVDKLRLHLALVGIYSALVGLLIFMTAVMDHPFRGDYNIGPEAFELVYNQLMREEGPSIHP